MNHNAETAKTSLRQVLISEVASLNNMVVGKKNFVNKIATKYPQYSRAYVEMYIKKCIINNKNRTKWGQAIDLFTETPNHFLVSNKKYFSTEYYIEDKDYAKLRKVNRKTIETSSV